MMLSLARGISKRSRGGGAGAAAATTRRSKIFLTAPTKKPRHHDNHHDSRSPILHSNNFSALVSSATSNLKWSRAYSAAPSSSSGSDISTYSTISNGGEGEHFLGRNEQQLLVPCGLEDWTTKLQSPSSSFSSVSALSDSVKESFQWETHSGPYKGRTVTSSPLGGVLGGQSSILLQHQAYRQQQSAMAFSTQPTPPPEAPPLPPPPFSSASSSSGRKPTTTNTATLSAPTPVPPKTNSTAEKKPSSSSAASPARPPPSIPRSKIPTPASAPPINSLKDKVPSPVAIFKSALDWTIYLGRTLLVGLFIKFPKSLWHYATHPSEIKTTYQHLKQVAKDEAHHYWVGAKLLAADVRTARDLTSKTLHGNALTRRERNQLLRTVADLFRLIPFSMFLIIPAAEFALPFVLRIFPNLLPSTFQDSLKAEENMKRELQSRIAMAQFFQETLEELAKEQTRKARKARKSVADSSSDSDDSATETNSTPSILTKQEDSAQGMLDFLQKARNGEMLSSDVIIRYAKYFADDLTLDNMPRMQLINMCKYMSIPPYGSDSFLRFQLRHRIRILKEDDQRILWEGIESLTKMELREACQERGMRSTGLSKENYKYALQQWLDLSVSKNVPISLLIMSRSLFLSEDIFNPPDKTNAANDAVTKAAEAVSSITTEQEIPPTPAETFTTTAASTADKDKLTATSVALASPILDAPSISQEQLPISPSPSEVEDPNVVGIADAISGLDKSVVDSVILEVATEEEKQTDPEIRKLKLSVVSQQNEMIKQEQADKEQQLQASLAKTKEKEQQQTAVVAAASDDGESTLEPKEADPPIPTVVDANVISSVDISDSPVLSTATDPRPITAEAVPTDSMSEGEDEVGDDDLSTEEMDALRQLCSDDPVSNERAQLEQIKAAMTKSEDDEEAHEPATVVDSDTLPQEAGAAGEQYSAESTLDVGREEAMTPEASDRLVAKTIERLDSSVEMSDQTTFASSSSTETIESSKQPDSDTSPEIVVGEPLEAEEPGGESIVVEDPVVARLKKRVESMVDKIEDQLSDVHSKIGDKLHLLDKDKDGILSQEEVAQALQRALKRDLTSEEAQKIAAGMDLNHDGVLTVKELMNWIDEHKLEKYVLEGRDAEMDRIMEDAVQSTAPSETNADDSSDGSNENDSKEGR